ncbi:MAG: response regulator transcription factor [Ferruginibacter sp.]
MQKIKLFIADDHQILVDGLISFFQDTENIDVIGFANDGTTLLRKLFTERPDIILLDLNMPLLDGIKTLDLLKKDYSNIKILILSNYNQSQLVMEARAKGADGYILKNGSKNELMDAIESIMNGKTYFNLDELKTDKEVPKVYTDEFMRKYMLTKREVEIIKLLCNEMNSREIGEKLFISEYTVNTHRRNILSKLDIKKTAGLINFARQNNIC